MWDTYDKKKLATRLSIFMLSLLFLAACTSGENGDKKDQQEVTEEGQEEIFNPGPNEDATQISIYNTDCIKEQVNIDEEINAKYEEESYTFEDPFIIVNPYNVDPLTALLKFETETPVEIEVIVGTGENEVAIEKTWEWL